MCWNLFRLSQTIGIGLYFVNRIKPGQLGIVLFTSIIKHIMIDIPIQEIGHKKGNRQTGQQDSEQHTKEGLKVNSICLSRLNYVTYLCCRYYLIGLSKFI